MDQADSAGKPAEPSVVKTVEKAAERTVQKTAEKTAEKTAHKATEAIRASADRVEDSTAQMAGSAVRMEDSADRRTVLAADRTVLAAERTYAAWVRTGLAALASGVGARTLLEDVVPHGVGSATATMLILFSAFCFGAGVWRQLWASSTRPAEAPSLPSALLIVVNGFLALVALIALAGIWMG